MFLKRWVSYVSAFLAVLFVVVWANPGSGVSSTRYLYDQNSRLIYISAEDGRYLSLVYDENGNMTDRVYSENLVMNSSFEHEAMGWTLSSQMTIQSTYVKEGKRALQYASGSAATQTTDTETIRVKPNTTYTLNGWLGDSLSSGVVYIDWLEFDASNQLIVDGHGLHSSGKNQWQYGSTAFTTNPNTDQVIVRFVVENGVGIGLADGVELVEGTSPRLYKASFEKEEAHWNIPDRMTIQETYAKDGNRALQYASEIAATRVADTGMIRVKPNTTYTLSGWLGDSLSSGAVYIDWLEYDAVNQTVVDGYGLHTSGKNQWQYGSATFTTSPHTDKVNIRLVVENGVGIGLADRIELVEGGTPWLYHASFEKEEAHWNTPDRMTLQETYVKEGKRSLQYASEIAVTQAADTGMIRVSPNTTYTLSGWLGDSLTTGVIYIDWLEYNAANQVVVDGGGLYPSGKNYWQYGSTSFTTSSTTEKVVIRVVAEQAAGSGFADGIELVRGSKPWLYKTSFESGDFHWNLPNNMRVQNIHAVEGNLSLQYVSEAALTEVADSGAIQVKPNTTYTLSGWLSDSLSSGMIYVDWLEYDAVNQTVVDGYGLHTSGKNQWQYHSASFTTSPSAERLVIRVVAGNAVGSGFVDGIQLVEDSNP